MARLAGFVLGALLVIGLLAQMNGTAPVVLSTPADNVVSSAEPVGPAAATPDAPVEAAVESSVDKVPDETVMVTDARPAARSGADAAGRAQGEPDAALPEPAPQVEVTRPVAKTDEITGFFEEDISPPFPAALAAPEQQPLPELEFAGGQQWQPVWQAFAARRSAEGFSQRLASLTGLEYRVEKLGPGRYQVEVGYDDEPDRVQSLARIEQVTGLVLARSENASP